MWALSILGGIFIWYALALVVICVLDPVKRSEFLRPDDMDPYVWRFMIWGGSPVSVPVVLLFWAAKWVVVLLFGKPEKRL